MPFLAETLQHRVDLHRVDVGAHRTERGRHVVAVAGADHEHVGHLLGRPVVGIVVTVSSGVRIIVWCGIPFTRDDPDRRPPPGSTVTT